jgi:hypothetical protein
VVRPSSLPSAIGAVAIGAVAHGLFVVLFLHYSDSLTPIMRYPIATLFALVTLFLNGCSTAPSYGELEAERRLPTEAYVYRFFAMSLSSPREANTLKASRLKRFAALDGNSVYDVLKTVNGTYARAARAVRRPALPLIFEDPEAEARVHHAAAYLLREDVSFAEVYDRLCRSAGVIWWVNGGIHIATPNKTL